MDTHLQFEGESRSLVYAYWPGVKAVRPGDVGATRQPCRREAKFARRLRVVAADVESLSTPVKMWHNQAARDRDWESSPRSRLGINMRRSSNQ